MIRKSTNKKPRNYAGFRAVLDCLELEYGGERGSRTLDTLRYTHFPGVLLRPLGHLTVTFNTENLKTLCKGAQMYTSAH